MRTETAAQRARRVSLANVKTARWWVGLSELETTINNSLLPLSCHLELGDAALHEAMRKLAAEIARCRSCLSTSSLSSC